MNGRGARTTVNPLANGSFGRCACVLLSSAKHIEKAASHIKSIRMTSCRALEQCVP